MKIPDKSKDKKEKVKKKLGHIKNPKPKKEHVLIVAQEIKFARLLSGNEKKSRDRVLKTLKKWLLNCFEKGYEFKEDDFLRVWKGLFYAVWMSDKPLIQEELCESIAAVLDVFPAKQVKYAVLMFKAGLKVLATEWYGIDQHRMDKFLMLVRRYLRGSLRCLARCDWSLKSCQIFSKMLDSSDGILALQTPHYARNGTSMILHFLDCYLEEIAKVSNGSIPDTSLVELLRPICGCLRGEGGKAIAGRRVLLALLRQSEEGIKYTQATQAWKQMGCPEGGPEALELVSDDDTDSDNDMEQDGDDSSDRPLDPRAGRVDVEITPLPVPAALIADVLRGILSTATSKAHRRIRICLQRFEQLSNSTYPLPVELPPTEQSPPLKATSRQSARALHALEKNLVASTDELALRGLSRKHRKRLLAKARSGVSILDDVEKAKTATNDDWQVESTEPSTKKQKKDDTNKENKKRKREDTNKTKNIKKKKIGKDKDSTKDSSKINKNFVKVDTSKNNIKQNGVVKEKKNPNVKENGVVKEKKNLNVKENGIVKENIKNNEKEAKVVKEKQKPKENGIPKVSKDKKQKSPEKILNGKDKKITTKKNPENILKQTKDNKITKNPTLVVNKVKSFQKQTKKIDKAERKQLDTPKKVKFVLKNNSMQRTVDYYKSVRSSPSIPYDGAKKPTKTNLKPSTPSPINPFFKKKMKLSFG